MSSLLELHGLTKRFGPITAVDDVSLEVRRGEVLGFLGPNGAGKTTTMRMITGYLSPTKGTAKVCGFDVITQAIEVKRRIGYLPEGAPVYSDMTPDAVLKFVADVRGLPSVQVRQRTQEVIERLQLQSVLHRPIETLSKGFKRRVGLAKAILLDPEVLILDEPTDGLDPNQKYEVRALLSEMAGEKAIVISTHILEEVEAVCSRAVIIAEGRLVADATPAELHARSALHKAVRLRLASPPSERLISSLEALAGVERVEAGEAAEGVPELIVYPRSGQDILNEVRACVNQSDGAVVELFVERGRLDDVFRDLTLAA